MALRRHDPLAPGFFVYEGDYTLPPQGLLTYRQAAELLNMIRSAVERRYPALSGPVTYQGSGKVVHCGVSAA